MNEIQTSRIDNPGSFFSRAQPDSVFRSQQVWTVEYEENDEEEGKNRKIKVTSSVPETVKREVKNAWEKVFTSKKSKNKDVNEAFISKKFIKRRNKILGKDQKLIAQISETETIKMIKNLMEQHVVQITYQMKSSNK